MAANSILITGSNGYLGTIVLKRLYDDYKSGKISCLVGLDIRETPSDKKLEGVHYYKMDIRDTKIADIVQQHQIDTILHLAAIIDSNSLPREVQYEIDVLGTKNCLEAAVHNKVQRFIMSSSGAAYGYHADNPEWLTEDCRLRGNEIFAYSHHKRLAEELLAEYRTQYPSLQQTIFRVGTILGATTKNLITNLFDKKTILGIRGFASPFVFVWDEDVVGCLLQAIYSDKSGIYNVAGDGAIPNQEIAKILGKKYRALPAGLLRWGLRIAKTLRLSQYGPDQLLFLQYRPVLDNTKLKTIFQYIPKKTSLETFLYYLEQQNKSIASRDVSILYPTAKK